MIVYHGSNQEIRKPDCLHSRRSVDFGPGFYVTPIVEQAKNWTAKYKRKGEAAVVSQYELDDQAFSAYKTLRFDTYSGEWLDYMCLPADRGTIPTNMTWSWAALPMIVSSTPLTCIMKTLSVEMMRWND